MAGPGNRRARPRTVFLGSLIAVVGLLIGGCSSDGGGPSRPDIAARIAGVAVTSAEVETLAGRAVTPPTLTGETAPAAPDADLTPEQVRRIALNFYLRLRLLESLAAARGIDAEPLDSLEAALELVPEEQNVLTGVTPEDVVLSERAGAISEALAAQIFPDVSVSDDELQRRYDELAIQFQAGWQANVRVAVFPTQDVAEQFRSSLGPSIPFDETAVAFGAFEAGSMGLVTSGSLLAPPVLEAIEPLQAGELSVPVEGSIGWIVFLAETREQTGEVTFDQARPDLLLALQDQKRQRLFDDWFEQRLREAEVVVDPYYGTWNPARGAVGPA
jgi:hypothetical protein